MYAKAVGNKMVTCGMTKWDGKPSNHTFLATVQARRFSTLCKCQTKQKPRRF